MKKVKNKSFKRENGQTTIFNAMDNLKALSQSQKKIKANLSKVIVVHDSDSEHDEKSVPKIRVKRRLSFSSPHDGHSESFQNKPTGCFYVFILKYIP